MTRPFRRPISGTAVALLILLSGCLPSSCRRDEDRAIMPSDSLSREVAASVPMDTLRPVWTAGAARLSFPRTVRFGAGDSDSLFASDVEQNSLFVFDTMGELLQQIDTIDLPYIAGVRGDTLAVFSPSALTIDLFVAGKIIESIPIPDENRPPTSLVYAAYGNGIFYKRVAPDSGGFITHFNSAGVADATYDLEGPHWRHAGLLRTWGDSLVSLSGFRPVVDIIYDGETGDGGTISGGGTDDGGTISGGGTDDGGTINDGGTVDTLALRGFDSPMLARSRSFMLGAIDDAPLLSASAAGEGPYLFVMNMRPGWLQIDVFDRSGRLKHRLTQPERKFEKNFYPQDLDVRQRADGSYAIAVAVSNPEPSIRMYTWDADDVPAKGG